MDSPGLALLIASVRSPLDALRGLRERRLAWRWLRESSDLADTTRESQLVRAIGVVRPLDETLIAPLSGRTCVAYRSRARGAATRETMQLRPFVLDLGDEEIVIDGEHAMFVLPPIRLGAADRDREASFLARHAVTSSYVRCEEVALEPGAIVAICGTLVLVPRDEPPDGELGFRDPPPPSQRIVGNRRRPLVFAT